MTIEFRGSKRLVDSFTSKMIEEGFTVVRKWSKKKYWLFGLETFYVEMEQVTINSLANLYRFSKQFSDLNNAGIDGSKAGEYWREIYENIGKFHIDRLKNGFHTGGEFVERPLSLKQLQTELDHTLSMEDYDYAAELRDQIKEIDAKN